VEIVDKLPVAFPVRIEDTPAHAEGHPERWTIPPPGGTGIDPNASAAIFSEGIAVGYRWYDQPVQRHNLTQCACLIAQ
jgi:hypothetical protein